jgi:hypothetical protein
MSAKRPELTPELLRRILPALRLMVRFPTRSAKVVSFETGIELSDIYASTEPRGRPKARDVEAIERELDDAPSPASAPKFKDPAPKSAGDIDQSIAAQAQALGRPEADLQPADPWLNRRLQSKAMQLYAPLVAWLIENPRESQAAACRKFERDEGAFSAWRIGVFGHQLPGPEAFARFVTWANEQLARRREALLKIPGEDSAHSLQGTPGLCASVPSGSASVPSVSKLTSPPDIPRHTRRDSARNDELVANLLTAAKSCTDAALAVLKGAT